jgi:uncharacterized protein (DUF2141 family)
MGLLVCLNLLLVGLASAQNQTTVNVIHVDIAALRSDQGQVLCALFPPSNGFPSKIQQAIALTRSPISNRTAVCEFSGITPGRYAVSAVHDENNNGKLDINFIGIPKEGVGSSNDAKGRFGPPKFDAAAFQYAGGRLVLKINMLYIF